MNGSWKDSLFKQLRDKAFRAAYVAEDIRTGIAFQLRALREGRGWSQTELGRRSGKPQSVIARMEDPDYGRLSLKTLVDMAAAFDVALLVRFVPFSELVNRNSRLSSEALCVPDFDRDIDSGTDKATSPGADVINIWDRMPTMTTGSHGSQKEPREPRSDPMFELIQITGDRQIAL